MRQQLLVLLVLWQLANADAGADAFGHSAPSGGNSCTPAHLSVMVTVLLGEPSLRHCAARPLGIPICAGSHSALLCKRHTSNCTCCNKIAGARTLLGELASSKLLGVLLAACCGLCDTYRHVARHSIPGVCVLYCGQFRPPARTKFFVRAREVQPGRAPEVSTKLSPAPEVRAKAGPGHRQFHLLPFQASGKIIN